MIKAPETNRGKKHLAVRDHDEDIEEYNFTIFSMINFTFGFLDGMLNAMPTGGLLNTCGINLKAQREYYINATRYYEERDISNMVTYVYNGMAFQYNVTYYCYYGSVIALQPENIRKLFLNWEILNNIIFNLGFMWTDVVMLVVGKPGQTEVDYAYYFAFYTGDLIFRFLFKETDEGNCWYPWNAEFCTVTI